MGLLGGIGFTVSIFISILAYDVEALTSEAKIGVLMASILSAVTGYAFLRVVSTRAEHPIDEVQQAPVDVPGTEGRSGADSEN